MVSLGMALAWSVSACTVLCPTVGVVRGATSADVVTDEHGCEHAPDGTSRVPCTHPGPVSYARTIGENAIVGLLVDAAVFVLVTEVADSPL